MDEFNFTAEDARLLSSNIKDENSERKLYLIIRDIKEEANKGGRSITCNSDISTYVINRLKELGYVVEYSGGDFEKSYYEISW